MESWACVGNGTTKAAMKAAAIAAAPRRLFRKSSFGIIMLSWAEHSSDLVEARRAASADSEWRALLRWGHSQARMTLQPNLENGVTLEFSRPRRRAMQTSSGSMSARLIAVSGLGPKEPAAFVVEAEKRRLLLDCGEGPERGRRPDFDVIGRIDAIVLTH